MIKTSALALSISLALASTAGAVTRLSVGPDDSCGSGGCFSTGGAYRQSVDLRSITGTTSIGALRLNRQVLGDQQDMVFRLTFETSEGVRVGDWGSFMIAGLGGDEVNLNGRAFEWNAEYGNLVVRLDLVEPETGGGGGGFAASALPPAPDLPAGRLASGGAPASDGWGVGSRTLGPIGVMSPESPLIASAAPEPAAWAMMLTGFLGAGAMLRRRRVTLAHKYS